MVPFIFVNGLRGALSTAINVPEVEHTKDVKGLERLMMSFKAHIRDLGLELDSSHSKTPETRNLKKRCLGCLIFPRAKDLRRLVIPAVGEAKL